jgi:hypothetical protein
LPGQVITPPQTFLIIEVDGSVDVDGWSLEKSFLDLTPACVLHIAGFIRFCPIPI